MNLSIISPKIGLGLIKNRIEAQTNLTIKDFAIWFYNGYEHLKIDIVDKAMQNHELSIKEPKLTEVITSYITKKLDKKVTIDALCMEYKDSKICAYVFHTDKESGKKVKDTIKF